jgi:hypothetical protein
MDGRRLPAEPAGQFAVAAEGFDERVDGHDGSICPIFADRQPSNSDRFKFSGQPGIGVP